MKIWHADDPWLPIKDQIIRDYIHTAKERAALAKEYIQPLRLRNYDDRNLGSRRSFNIRDAKEEKIL